jgi:hypothetical protein
VALTQQTDMYCLILSLLLLLPSAALAGQDVCDPAAKEIEIALRAYKPAQTRERISIAGAVKQKSVAGLDFGSAYDPAGLSAFPMSREQRESFTGATTLVYRAGGAKGLVMLDPVRGTAHCHAPIVFTLASGKPVPLAVPAPDDPFELCGTGGVALGAVEQQPFYVQTTDEKPETGTLKIFVIQVGKLTEACTVSASYGVAHETVASFCTDPALCMAFSAKAAQWAASAAEGWVNDLALTAAAVESVPQPESLALPLFGGQTKNLAPYTFSFAGGGAWQTLDGDPRADFVHIGNADSQEGAASGREYLLIALYKDGQPAASFIVERKRNAFKSLSVQKTGE